MNAKPHTIIIKTTRMAELAEFYCQGFDWSPAEATGDNHVGFETQTVYFGFDLVETEPVHPGAVSVWFEVENLDTSFERFVELGAQVIYPPTQKPWGDRLAALYDPDGNVFGLAQR